jgi:hypothetical protein
MPARFCGGASGASFVWMNLAWMPKRKLTLWESWAPKLFGGKTKDDLFMDMLQNKLSFAVCGFLGGMLLTHLALEGTTDNIIDFANKFRDFTKSPYSAAVTSSFFFLWQNRDKLTPLLSKAGPLLLKAAGG